jgi:hypothetical protein
LTLVVINGSVFQNQIPFTFLIAPLLMQVILPEGSYGNRPERTAGMPEIKG